MLLREGLGVRSANIRSSLLMCMYIRIYIVLEEREGELKTCQGKLEEALRVGQGLTQVLVFAELVLTVLVLTALAFF